MSDFPNRLKKLRSDSKLTQKQLAEQLNVSQNAVYNWENGKREPNLDMMKKIAKVFDIALYMLLDDTYPLPDITSDAWKNRARFVGDTEMENRPKPFTAPFHNSLSDNENTEEKERHYFEWTNERLQSGKTLSPKDVQFRLKYLDNLVKKVGEIFVLPYSLLNEQGKERADEIIEQAIKQVSLLTKIPEYRKEQNKNRDFQPSNPNNNQNPDG